MTAGYRIGRAAPDLRIGEEKLAAIYLGSQRIYPSSLSFAVPLGGAAYSTTRYPADLRVGLAAIVLDTTSFAATRPDIVLRARRTLDMSAASFTLTRPANTLRRALRLSCNHNLTQIYGQDAIVALGNIMGAEQGLFALTPRVVDMTPDRYLAMATRSLTVTRHAADVRATRNFAMAQTNRTLTGYAVGISKGVRMVASGASFAVTNPALTIRAASRLNASPQTSFVLTGRAADTRLARRLDAAPPRSLVLTGRDMTLKAARRMAAAAGTFSLTGPATDLAYAAAAPAIVANAIGSVTGNYHTAPLPSGIVAGELLLCFVSIRANAACTLTTPAGWTELYNIAPAAQLRRAACYYKFADGTEGSTVTLTASAAAGMVFLTLSLRISSASDIAVATAMVASTIAGDPPLLTPPWNGKLWLATDHASGSVNGNNTAMPTGYTGIIRAVYAGGSPYALVAHKTALLSSDDPSAMTGAGTFAAHVNATIAIK